MRSNLEGAKLYGNLLQRGNRLGILNQTLTGTTAIPADAPHVLALDPGGAARNVTLPANPKPGDWFLLINTADALEVITVQNSAGGALVPACTPTQSEVALIVYVNAALGWRSFVGAGA